MMRNMAVGDQIKLARKERGMNQKELGEALGVGQSVVSEMEAGKLKNWPLHAATIIKVLGKPRSFFEPETDEPAKRPPTSAPGMAEPGRTYISSDNPVLPIIGTVQAGAWLEVDAFDQREPEFHPAITDIRFPRARQWLSRVVGDSMNALEKLGRPAGILEGDLVHIVDAIDIEYEPRTGDIVEVERIRFDGAEREVTLKQVEVVGDKCLLWPRSLNPKWSEPIAYRDGLSEKEEIEVRIRGKLLQVLRTW